MSMPWAKYMGGTSALELARRVRAVEAHGRPVPAASPPAAVPTASFASSSSDVGLVRAIRKREADRASDRTTSATDSSQVVVMAAEAEAPSAEAPAVSSMVAVHGELSDEMEVICNAAEDEFDSAAEDWAFSIDEVAASELPLRDRLRRERIRRSCSARDRVGAADGLRVQVRGQALHSGR